MRGAARRQAAWAADDVRTYLHRDLELFGRDRLISAAHWTISVLAGGYVRVWEQLSILLDEMSPSERDAILCGTATAFYRIPGERLEAGPA